MSEEHDPIARLESLEDCMQKLIDAMTNCQAAINKQNATIGSLLLRIEQIEKAMTKLPGEKEDEPKILRV
jgi:hypothetical protein